MVNPSGRVETRSGRPRPGAPDRCSGWLIRPGELKLVALPQSIGDRAGSGWLIRPGELKLPIYRRQQDSTAGSGWLLPPGKLKQARRCPGALGRLRSE